MADAGGAAHRGGKAAVNASSAQSRELGLAAVAHLSRYRGASREHTESDPRVVLGGGQDRQLAPLDAPRNDLVRSLRGMQDARRFKPSTVACRLSVVAGFSRTCVLDGVPERSPADCVRRPTVPPESPTLGLTHLQFEAVLTAARRSANPFGLRSCVVPGRSPCGFSRPSAPTSTTWARSPGTGCPGCRARPAVKVRGSRRLQPLKDRLTPRAAASARGCRGARSRTAPVSSRG